MTRKILTCAVALLFSFCPVMTAASAGELTPELEAQTLETSLLWLTVIDQGLYEQSWTQANEKFQEIVPKEEWIKQLTDVRQPLGEVKSRELYDKGYFGKIPNHPGMEMVVIQFKTSFQNKELAYETISPVRINGGPWKISGYYIADSVDIKEQ